MHIWLKKWHKENDVINQSNSKRETGKWLLWKIETLPVDRWNSCSSRKSKCGSTTEKQKKQQQIHIPPHYYRLPLLCLPFSFCLCIILWGLTYWYMCVRIYFGTQFHFPLLTVPKVCVKWTKRAAEGLDKWKRSKKAHTHTQQRKREEKKTKETNERKDVLQNVLENI